LSSLDLVGVVQSNDAQSTWQLTLSGLEKVQHFRRAIDPRLVLSVRPGVPLEDCTNWELLQILTDNGWQMLPAPKDTKKFRALPPYTIGGSRVWYNRCIDVSSIKLYVVSLLRADDLMKGGTLVAVHHGQQHQYYKKVLAGSVTGVVNVALAIEDAGLEHDGGLLSLPAPKRSAKPREPKASRDDGDAVDEPGSSDDVGNIAQLTDVRSTRRGEGGRGFPYEIREPRIAPRTFFVIGLGLNPSPVKRVCAELLANVAEAQPHIQTSMAILTE
jgi:hypothetical protein